MDRREIKAGTENDIEREEMDRREMNYAAQKMV